MKFDIYALLLMIFIVTETVRPCDETKDDKFFERYSVVTQIQDDISLFQGDEEIQNPNFEYPILCIGTGKIKLKTLRLKGVCPTIVRPMDKTLDFCKSIKPDYVSNCWAMDLKLSESEHYYGCIYFAHVENGEFLKENIVPLSRYYDYLRSGGVFLYKSEVLSAQYLNPNEVENFVTQKLLEYVSQNETILKSAGFENIKYKIKNENQIFGPNTYSLLFYAKKGEEAKQIVEESFCAYSEDATTLEIESSSDEVEDCFIDM